VDFSETIGGSE